MLSNEENELLTRTGEGSPMGDFYRRFWLPVMLAEEIPTPDCPPVRIDILGERLVAFRDSKGRIGLIDRHCPHRRADLFFGRNEECGLRCVYHGWKFDVEGRCVDMPAEPPETNFKHKIRVTAYPCRERAGLIWAYMGPKELSPEMPELEWARVPDNQRLVRKYIVECNFLQVLEGDIDTTHSAFLHFGGRDASQVKRKKIRKDMTAMELRAIFRADDTGKWTNYYLKDTDYGVMIGAYREVDELNSNLWHVTHWLMPSYQLVSAGGPGLTHLCHIQVPIDDDHCVFYMVHWNPDRPLASDEIERLGGAIRDSLANQRPELIPGTYLPVRNRTNDYLIDRELQKKWNYTGIKGVREQDLAVTEGMGSIMDRSKERLGAGDRAIIAVRRRMLETVREMLKGKNPYPAYHGDAYRVRQLDTLLEKDIPLEEGARESLKAQV